MLKFLRNWKMIFGCVTVFALASIIPANASSVDAPTVLKINSFKSYSLVAPVISGVTRNNTSVLVYIDDIFAGSAKTKSNETASDSFYFQAFKLEAGTHSVYLVAEDKTSLVRSERSREFNIVVSDLPAPTLVVPNKDTITAKVRPLIEGFTKSGSFVHLYIDGTYNGKTAIVEHKSGTAHFVYSPFLNLSVGRHKMWAISEDVSGRKSLASKVVEFNIEEPMPAPTIYDPVVNNSTVYNRPYIVGLSKNNSKIRIFIDHVFDGEFTAKNNKSGTANFAYKPSKNLKKGNHFVYVTSVDSRGKESPWSNIVYFKVTIPKVAMISDSAVEEEATITDETNVDTNSANDAIAQQRIKDFLVFADLYDNDKKLRLNDDQYQELQTLLDKKSELSITNDKVEKLEALLKSKDIEPDEDAVTKNNIDNKDNTVKDNTVSDDTSKDIATDTSETGGSIDEGKQQQSKLGWNAIIFILFLVSVIAWIFWVNRELIKEKKEQEEAKKDK